MATTTDDKGEVKLLPANDLAAIYDTNTHILYLYARGTYVTPALTSFARQTWIGGRKFAFEGFYTHSPGPDDKPTENQFAEDFHIEVPESLKDVIIVTADPKGGKIENRVRILRVPVPPQ
jgi:hypothetical protein